MVAQSTIDECVAAALELDSFRYRVTAFVEPKRADIYRGVEFMLCHHILLHIGIIRYKKD